MSDPVFDEVPDRPAAYGALDALEYIEEHAPLIHYTLSPEEAWVRLGAQGLHLISFHAALPFSEAERGYMFENMSFDNPPKDDEWDFYDGEIISEGVRKHVVARTLINRWLAWRQQTDEFEGQGSLDQARTTLAYLIHNATPGASMPQSYIDRGGELPR